MRRALLILAVAAPSRAEEEAKHVDATEVLSEMSWLAGSWSGAMWGGTFEAYYSTPAGGKILSYSRLLKDGKTAFHEFEIFECRAHTVHLRPHPGGRPAGEFMLKSADPKKRQAVFENPKKDFPTRIVYRRVTDEKLVITLTDPHGGSTKVEKFELTRAK